MDPNTPTIEPENWFRVAMEARGAPIHESIEPTEGREQVRVTGNTLLRTLNSALQNKSKAQVRSCNITTCNN